MRLLIYTAGSELDEFVVECQEWWAQNCLFLEAESRKAFYDALNQASTHVKLIKSGASKEDKKSSWETISRAGPLLVKAVELPVINADEAEEPKTNADR